MAEELENNVNELEDENIKRTEERIKNLSSKVKTASEERDAERQAREEAEAKALAAEKKAQFLEQFSDMSGKYQNASEHRDKILEKFNAGYALEDAVVSVLNAEGKLSPQAEVAPIVETAGGGSASTVIPSGDRSVDDMSQDERRKILMEASESGELGKLIRNWGGN